MQAKARGDPGLCVAGQADASCAGPAPVQAYAVRGRVPNSTGMEGLSRPYCAATAGPHAARWWPFSCCSKAPTGEAHGLCAAGGLKANRQHTIAACYCSRCCGLLLAVSCDRHAPVRQPAVARTGRSDASARTVAAIGIAGSRWTVPLRRGRLTGQSSTTSPATRFGQPGGDAGWTVAASARALHLLAPEAQSAACRSCAASWPRMMRAPRWWLR